MHNQKDIFIDNSVAQNCNNPMKPEYKEFINWLRTEGVLVVSQKLLNEFNDSLRNISEAKKHESIIGTIGILTQNGRLDKKSSNELKSLKFPKRIETKLTCNYEDRVHIKTVLLSIRKYAIAADKKLRKDINGYPKYERVQPIAVSRPSAIPYAD